MSTRKSFSTETSERYARALFEVASESFELENVENSLNELLVIYDSSSEFISFIKNPTYSNKDQLKAIDIISEKLKFTKNLKKFL